MAYAACSCLSLARVNRAPVAVSDRKTLVAAFPAHVERNLTSPLVAEGAALLVPISSRLSRSISAVSTCLIADAPWTPLRTAMSARDLRSYVSAPRASSDRAAVKSAGIGILVRLRFSALSGPIASIDLGHVSTPFRLRLSPLCRFERAGNASDKPLLVDNRFEVY